MSEILNNNHIEGTIGLPEKLERLKGLLKSYGSVVIAYSGGVDSTFLLAVAHEVLGDGAVAVTIKSDVVPEIEVGETIDFCKEREIQRIEIPVNCFDIEGFADNRPERCYICKKSIFTQVLNTAKGLGIVVVAEGSNVDDGGDYRPGMKAIEELGVKSPLREAGLTKKEIRILSKEMGLPTWAKPSFACLASRFAYGDTITPEKLKLVEGAEQILRENGFKQFRVRMHGDNLARIEVTEEELDKLYNMKEEIYTQLRSLGFIYITMDLKGYRTGAMNETL